VLCYSYPFDKGEVLGLDKRLEHFFAAVTAQCHNGAQNSPAGMGMAVPDPPTYHWRDASCQ